MIFSSLQERLGEDESSLPLSPSSQEGRVKIDCFVMTIREVSLIISTRTVIELLDSLNL